MTVGHPVVLAVSETLVVEVKDGSPLGEPVIVVVALARDEYEASGVSVVRGLGLRYEEGLPDTVAELVVEVDQLNLGLVEVEIDCVEEDVDDSDARLEALTSAVAVIETDEDPETEELLVCVVVGVTLAEAVMEELAEVDTLEVVDVVCVSLAEVEEDPEGDPEDVPVADHDCVTVEDTDDRADAETESLDVIDDVPEDDTVVDTLAVVEVLADTEIDVVELCV